MNITALIVIGIIVIAAIVLDGKHLNDPAGSYPEWEEPTLDEYYLEMDLADLHDWQEEQKQLEAEARDFAYTQEINRP